MQMQVDDKSLALASHFQVLLKVLLYASPPPQGSIGAPIPTPHPVKLCTLE
jgi:hypothetical protein